MFKIKPFFLTSSKTAFAFLPILLAPLCLGTSPVLLFFYKLQLGLSIVAAFGSLGLGTYVYGLTADHNWHYSDRVELSYLVLAFKAVSSIFFSLGLVIAFMYFLYFDDLLLFTYALLVPFSFFFIAQQIQLAKMNFYLAFIGFAIPPLIFVAILILTLFLGDSYFNIVCIAILGIVDIVIFKICNLGQSIKKLSNRWRVIKQYLKTSRLNQKILIGLVMYICPPITTLIIIGWLENLNFQPQIIAAYYLYSRSIDSFVSLSITYFSAGAVQEILSGRKIDFNLKNLCFYILILIIFLIVVNYYVRYSVGYMNFKISILELILGLIKFGMAFKSLLIIKKSPIIVGSKDLFILINIILINFNYHPLNIYHFQLSVILIFLIALIVLVILTNASIPKKLLRKRRNND